MEIRHATHPSRLGGFATADLRAHYLVEDLFPDSEVRLVYSHQDRTVVGGVAPSSPVRLETADPLRSSYFCERRELGVVNVGEAASMSVDGTSYDLAHGDCLYVGRGARDVVFGPGGYLYFDLPQDHRVVHLMGRPDETRNIIVANRQAVISPSWSVHCGFGTASYAFVWAMAGENHAFDDMDHVAIPSLR
ncbi:MAG: 5-dehydro-4-deoxy-D-glucuronate isomerase [Actinoallomurus sp.]|jgi:5-keto 4-deoxyuronate isomerase|nr:5-dehydro-4-deoxy-D-glucuronate isomerase [Actinoallomurus sp.]